MSRHFTRLLAPSIALFCLALVLSPGPVTDVSAAPASPPARIVGWNNLGMHCMDGDYSVFSLLPPFNTFHAQLVVNGLLVTNPAGYNVTYEAVADPAGSINTTSIGKTNFWTWVNALYGLDPAPDVGLLGVAMPGAGNTPRAMNFQGAGNWWTAEGLPIVPTDDQSGVNPYPMVRITARDGSLNVLATTDVVLPVSAEMTCTACHASGTVAQPGTGWVNDADPERDYRMNILRYHDDMEGGRPEYAAALAAKGYNASGLYASVVTDANPVLCADCHVSNALYEYGYHGISGIRSLTQAMHGRHASVTDPATGIVLNAGDRTACYLCHPGSATRCLRGAMGKATATDGTPEMQCQSCHGTMSVVGQPGRQGWLDEPTCQNCHTGTATLNSGQIRYANAYSSPGIRRVAADATFATNADTPAPGFSLFRLSKGHGGLACEACHGATHAEYPATAGANDNETTVRLQGHAGMLAECAICHGNVSALAYGGGPHGMHSVGQDWVDRHPDLLEGGSLSVVSCQSCHGTDYRGTVLSRSQADRTLNADDFGTKHVWRGQTIGCHNCHDGPRSESPPHNPPPVAGNLMAATLPETPVAVTLSSTGGGTLTYRIVSSPVHGTVALAGNQATYKPDAGFLGNDVFTFAVSNGFVDSNLATVYVTVKNAPIPPPVIETIDLAVSWLSLGLAKGKFRGTLEIANTGATSSPKTTLSLLLSTDQIADPGDLVLKPANVSALKVGILKVIKLKPKLPAGTTTTGRYFIAVVNPDGVFGETTLTNNTAVYGPLP